MNPKNDASEDVRSPIGNFGCPAVRKFGGQVEVSESWRIISRKIEQRIYTSGFYDLFFVAQTTVDLELTRWVFYNWCFFFITRAGFPIWFTFLNLDCNWPSMILGCWAKSLLTLMLTPAFNIYIIVRCTCGGERCDTVGILLMLQKSHSQPPGHVKTL